MFRKLITILAWLTLLGIAFATLSPIGLRPHLGAVSVERFWAFAVAALLFGLAYPRQTWLVALMVSGAAIGLEILQHLTPDRHGHVSDALVKLAGAIAGVGLSYGLNGWAKRRSALG
jgi:VanZ family protein